MSGFGSERSRQWNVYTSSDPSPSQTGEDYDAPWKSFGTSMNAISFGFVATAILISMFLIMAIFEHLFRPNPPFSSPEAMANGSRDQRMADKLGNPQTIPVTYASDFSVMMPGEQYPTYIAQPAPLPCQREGTYWPSHERNFVHP